MNLINKVTMKQLCLILSISMLPIFGYGQFIGDSVIVYVDNRVEIKVAVPDYANLKSSDSIIFALKEFKKIIPAIENPLSPGSAEMIKYSVGGNLTVEPGDPKIIYMNKDGELSNTGFRDQAIISGAEFKIFITTADMSKLSDLPLSNCFEQVIALLPKKTRWSRSIYYECTDGNITELENKNNRMDFLELQLGAGASLVKSTWVADLSFGIGLGLNTKGMIKSPYISSNMIFDFNTESNMNINTFLNIGHRWNLDKKSEKPNMLGVELGYLIVKQGDLFGENTFKLGFNWSPAKFITVSPQLFISDNFKTAYPAIRIGFGI